MVAIRKSSLPMCFRFLVLGLLERVFKGCTPALAVPSPDVLLELVGSSGSPILPNSGLRFYAIPGTGFSLPFSSFLLSDPGICCPLLFG